MESEDRWIFFITRSKLFPARHNKRRHVPPFPGSAGGHPRRNLLFFFGRVSSVPASSGINSPGIRDTPAANEGFVISHEDK